MVFMAGAVHIGKAAQLAGVSIDTIRFYQKLGLLRAANRSKGGYRLFDGGQIQDLKFVRRAQELGFSLNEIKELLALRQRPHTCSEVQSMLKRKLADVREKIKSLARLEAEIGGALRNCNRELRLEREVKHDDRCPLLTRFERNGTRNGKRDGVSGRKSTGK
jgi:MerR family mercuric resistance operon transcriptional regulator